MTQKHQLFARRENVEILLAIFNPHYIEATWSMAITVPCLYRVCPFRVKEKRNYSNRRFDCGWLISECQNCRFSIARSQPLWIGTTNTIGHTKPIPLQYTDSATCSVDYFKNIYSPWWCVLVGFRSSPLSHNQSEIDLGVDGSIPVFPRIASASKYWNTFLVSIMAGRLNLLTILQNSAAYRLAKICRTGMHAGPVCMWFFS